MTGDLALQEQEKKDKRIAAAVSFTVHAILLVLLFFIMAWRAKNPPDRQIGIEIALGFSEVGSGEVKTTAVPNPSPEVEDSKPPTPQPEVAPTPKVTPPPPQPVATPKAEPVVTTTAESPVVVKEELKPKPTPQPKEEVVKPKEEVVKKEEPVKEPEKPKAVYPGRPKPDAGGTGTAGTTTTATGNSSGDDANVAGDKGNPEGKIDSRNLYGKPGGGGGGSSLNMPGWRIDIEPQKDPYANERGKVVFRLKIDKDGELESVQLVESNVSPQVVKWYRDQIYKTSFSRTSAQAAYDKGATGTITFIIESR
jgi:periplasmic protein TonB